MIAAATPLLTSCGSVSNEASPEHSSRPTQSISTPSSPKSETPAGELDGVTGELIITRQRDLLGRGLINVLTHNGSGRQLLITNHELRADFFATQPAPLKVVSVPAGRDIAIQVPYGVANDCTDDELVTATLAFTYTTSTDGAPLQGSMPLLGTEILDRLRAEQCAGQDLHAQADATFDNISISDGHVYVDLVFERTAGTSDFTFGHAIGTVLVSVRKVNGDDNVSLEPSDQSLTVPLEFTVNRCDPHAQAEVTKRFSLDLEVSVDGDVAVPVSIPVTEITYDLEEIVQECVDSSG